MSKCKSCGAEIKWIRMKSGKRMPVDEKPITYLVDLKGDLVLVTPDGRVARAVFDPEADKLGYTSHFATCPNANHHRKRKEKNTHDRNENQVNVHGEMSRFGK